jgi:hypothetical protein
LGRAVGQVELAGELIVDNGCFGAAIEQRFGGGTIYRNLQKQPPVVDDERLCLARRRDERKGHSKRTDQSVLHAFPLTRSLDFSLSYTRGICQRCPMARKAPRTLVTRTSRKITPGNAPSRANPRVSAVCGEDQESTKAPFRVIYARLAIGAGGEH